jgi:catechol 2,3-dioxygenase-like lactoylglutathione lyase family enzyme
MEFTFDHVAQQVPDVAAAVAWYVRTVPNCRILYQDPTWALVVAGGVKLAFVQQGRHPNHVAWRVAPADLERLAAEHGRQVTRHRDGSRGFYLDAPGGHSIEIIAYPQPEEA